MERKFEIWLCEEFEDRQDTTSYSRNEKSVIWLEGFIYKYNESVEIFTCNLSSFLASLFHGRRWRWENSLFS